jgi:predicted outer membrane protein
MKRSIIALGCVLLAGPALAQSVGEKTGVNSTLGIAPTTADFVKEVAISDMFEIQSSQLAQDKGNAPEKSFASRMITDHTKTSGELKGLVSSGKVQANCRPRSTVRTRASSISSRAKAARTSVRISIRTRSARTRTRYRCSSAMPKAAIMPT